MTTEDKVEMYTDGLQGQSGAGGWGALLRFKGKEKELCGGEANTTNNRMELLAVIKGLATLNRPCKVVVYTDPNTCKRHFRMDTRLEGARLENRGQGAGENADLWQQLDAERNRHLHVEWRWVKGHAGHEYNERADQLANRGVELA